MPSEQVQAAQNLTEFLTKALPVKGERKVPDRVAQEQARNEALKAKYARLQHWREWTQRDHGTLPDNLVRGDAVKRMRERCDLSVGDVAEVLGVSPNDVESFEAGRKTFADKSFARLAEAMNDAIAYGIRENFDG